jgi:hypothetical protein
MTKNLKQLHLLYLIPAAVIRVARTPQSQQQQQQQQSQSAAVACACAAVVGIGPPQSSVRVLQPNMHSAAN